MLTINDLRAGAHVLQNGEPYLVLKHSFVKMGRGQGIMRTTLRNLKTGQVMEQSFHGQDKVKEADIRRSKANYLYEQDGSCYFMDSSSYDQFFVPREQLGEKAQFLTENLEVEVLNFNDAPLTVEIPPKVKLKVQSAPPGIRGDTAQGSVTKKVTLETGYTVDVPLFVKEGDLLEINTESGKYVGKG